MSAVLLVTASRALGRTPDAQLWTRRTIVQALSARAWTHVVHGGAPHGDMVADELALEFGLHRVRYALDGFIYRDDVQARRWSDGGSTHPLRRNAKEVFGAKRSQRKPDDVVFALGLLAPWSETDGTGHTLRLANRYEISWWRAVCPREYGP